MRSLVFAQLCCSSCADLAKSVGRTDINDYSFQLHSQLITAKPRLHSRSLNTACQVIRSAGVRVVSSVLGLGMLTVTWLVRVFVAVAALARMFTWTQCAHLATLTGLLDG